MKVLTFLAAALAALTILLLHPHTTNSAPTPATPAQHCLSLRHGSSGLMCQVTYTP